MIVYFYPEAKDEVKSGRSLRDTLRKLLRKRPDLWSLVLKTIQRVENGELSVLEKTDWAKHLRKCRVPLRELRIPPQGHGGVVRMYYAYYPGDSEAIIVLDAEFKKTRLASPGRAINRYLELFNER